MTTAEQTPRYVTVWVDKFVRGWDGGAVPGWHKSLSLLEAMTPVYASDAHVVGYYIERLDSDGQWVVSSKAPRMTIAALDELERQGGRMWFPYGFADIDCAEAHRDNTEAPDEWRVDMRERAEKVVPGCMWYDTKRGLRIVWAWAQRLNHVQHSENMRLAIAALRAGGLPADDLHDWGRCHRLPYVTRDGEPQFPVSMLCEPAVWTPPSLAESRSDFCQTDAEPVVTRAWDAIEKLPEKFALPEQIEEGSRHNTLKRYAASLRAKSMERDDIERELRAYEAQAGAHLRPYQGTEHGETDLANILDWVCKFPAGPSKPRMISAAPPAPPTANAFNIAAELYNDLLERGDSVELAERVLLWLEAETGVPCVYDLGMLWRYQALLGRFVVLDKHGLSNLISSMAGMGVLGERNAKGERKIHKLKLSSSFVADVVNMVHLRRIKPKFFDRCEGVAFKNGFVRVTAQGVQLVPHSPLHRCNYGVDADYTDDDPVQFFKFLNEVWVDVVGGDRQTQIETFGEWMGAMLTRQCATFQMAPWLTGGGNNGKSQLVIVVEGIADPERVTHVTPQLFSSEYYRAKIANAMLNTTTEVPASEITDTAASVIKALVSGEPMSGRHLHERPFDFTPNLGVLLAANDLPPVRDHSKGWWRRIIVFRFDQEFSGAGRVRNIGQKILDAERVMIICWALRQLSNLMQRGEYRETTATIEAKKAWQTSSDEIEQWLDDCIEQPAIPGEGTPCDTLYASFRIWAEASGVITGLTKRKFFDRLRKKYKPYTTGPSNARRIQYPLLIRKSSVNAP